jgi:hypothetical protein
MAISDPQPDYDLRSLSNKVYELAKKWLVGSTILRMSVFVIGILALLSQDLSKLSPFILAFLTAAAEYCTYQSNDQQSVAETLRRKTDMEDALGWPISRAELSDVLIRIPPKVAMTLRPVVSTQPYFASKQPVGPTRALENLQESAWWSKHLAEKMGYVYLWSMIVLIAISVAVLIISILTVNNFSVLSNIGRAVTSTIMLIFSLSLIRFTRGYFRFSQRCQRIEDQASELLQHETPTEVQAAKIMNEYHLSRASAPILPTWIWKCHRDRLNKIWRDYRATN